MSNIRDTNYSNHPFWDFVASMQQNPGAVNAPFAAAGSAPPPPPPPQGPEALAAFANNFPWGPMSPMPHRGRHGGPRGRTPPPPEHDRDEGAGHRHPHEHRGGSHTPPPPPPGHHGSGDEKGMPPPPPHDTEDPPSRAPTPPPPSSPPTEPHHPGHGPHEHHGRGGRCGGRGGRHGMRGGHGPGPPNHRHGSPGPHGRGHRGGRSGWRGGSHHGPHGPHDRHRGPPGGSPFGAAFPFDLNALASALAPNLFGAAYNNNTADNVVPTTRNTDNDGMFHPELDLFDTVEAYILHLSLPGAKKPDLSITYSSPRNSVTVSGVVTRPGVDEEMMDALALDERKVGAFEREIKLEEGVKIDEEGISAKLEDGVLRVVVPKILQEEEEEEYVNVKRISLE